jgi:hypothetical protein
MPSHFTLRMQFGPHQDPEVVTQQLRKLVSGAPVDEVMLFYYAEELNNGHDTLERVRAWIEGSRPYRQALAEIGIAVSLNPWHTVLHCDRGRALKPGQDWQRMVDPNGRAATAVVCPLDPGWRRYYAEVLELYAREGFRVIWIDDDIRFHNHAPLEWGGCFCPLHVAEFNRRNGTHGATREEIVAACTAPGTPHPWRDAWFDMWEDTHLAMLTGWREIVEAHGTRLGLMSSAPESHAAEGRRWEDWWETFGGGKPPIHRPHFWGYGDMMGSNLPNCIALLDQNRAVQPAQVSSGPEIECFTYGRWNKSFRQIGAQMALAHVLGSNELNISLFDFMGNDPDDEPERAQFLKAWRPVCDWLADEFPMTLRPVGVGIPWSQDMGRAMHTNESRKWQSLTCPSRGWARWLGAAGQAFAMEPGEEVNALAGPVVWSFDDEQLRAWLAKGVLLDGVAADILVQRGYGEWIGLQGGRMITQADALYSVEQVLDSAFGQRAGGQMSVNDERLAGRMFQGDLAEGVHIASDLRNPTQQVVGHGLVLYENAAGGRVAIVPWSADCDVVMNIQRATQLSKVLAYLDPKNTRGYAEGAPWLVPQFLRHGSYWRGVVWNAGPDVVREFTVHPPAGMPPITTVTHVDGEGNRHPARIIQNRVYLSPETPLHQWEFVVLSD